jgi:uncharacterized protein YabN with tetrapyrrole methylase and pyrophosphatase domain
MDSQRLQPDVFLVGTGILGVWHLTREAEAAFAASRHVFLVDPVFGVAEHIERLGPAVHNLLGEYEEGRNRVEIYHEMAARVTAKALEEPPVSFAVYGHPTFFVYPSSLIKRAARYIGLEVQTLAGISSIDTMLIDLELEPGMNGLQIHDANAILVERRALDVEVPCLLLQVDAVESAYHTSAPSRASRFRRLQEHLLESYPPEHLVTNIRSSSFPIFEAERTTFPLRDLADEFASKQLGGTLFIPPARAASFDEELARQVYDPFHLTRITYRTT